MSLLASDLTFKNQCSPTGEDFVGFETNLKVLTIPGQQSIDELRMKAQSVFCLGTRCYRPELGNDLRKDNELMAVREQA